MLQLSQAAIINLRRLAITRDTYNQQRSAVSSLTTSDQYDKSAGLGERTNRTATLNLSTCRQITSVLTMTLPIICRDTPLFDAGMHDDTPPTRGSKRTASTDATRKTDTPPVTSPLTVHPNFQIARPAICQNDHLPTCGSVTCMEFPARSHSARPGPIRV